MFKVDVLPCSYTKIGGSKAEKITEIISKKPFADKNDYKHYDSYVVLHIYDDEILRMTLR